MANFIKETLEPGEQVMFNGRLHWSFNFRYSMWGYALLIAGIAALIYSQFVTFDDGSTGYSTAVMVLGIVCAVVGAVSVFYAYIIRSKTEFAVTTSRFIQKDGLFNIKMTEIPLFKIETVNFYQTFLDRIIGTGSIELVGSGGTNHRVDYVQKPLAVRNLITTMMKNCKEVNVLSEK